MGAPDPAAPVERLLVQALRGISSAVSLVDVVAARQPLVFVNAAYERLTGWSATDALGRPWSLVEGPETDAATAARMRDAVRSSREIRTRVRHHRRDGSAYWSETLLSPVQDRGRVTHYLAVQKDVSEQVEAERRTVHLAHHDVLTGLPNRRELERHLARALRRAVPGVSAVALLFLDLDGFKPVNDRYGHDVGDEVLRAVTGRWAGLTRRQDLLARYGGDEFALVLADLPLDAADDVTRAVAVRTAEAVAAPLAVLGGTLEVEVGVSVGTAVSPRDGTTPASLVLRADAEMYVRKRSRRRAAP